MALKRGKSNFPKLTLKPSLVQLSIYSFDLSPPPPLFSSSEFRNPNVCRQEGLTQVLKGRVWGNREWWGLWLKSCYIFFSNSIRIKPNIQIQFDVSGTFSSKISYKWAQPPPSRVSNKPQIRVPSQILFGTNSQVYFLYYSLVLVWCYLYSIEVKTWALDSDGPGFKLWICHL